ncbi:tyrosine-type recombinase/integrase [Bacillus cereus]|uniref:tyrosine-type recombinase/integrase n=1 Tax=Bacillus cereus TaxID=1396 RepID=UPI000B4B900C|nr:site-specific integrase [Bacillus cereus]
MFENYLLDKYSEKVAKGYIKDYKDFINYINTQQISVEQTSEANIREFIQTLRENGYTSDTVAKKLSLLRQYFKWLRKNGTMVHNPMDNIQQPKIVKENVEISNEKLEFLKSKVNDSESIRDKIIFKLLMDEGIKPNEMIKITFKDCDIDKRMIYLERKSVVISEETARNLEELKNIYSDGFILTNQHGHPLKESGIYFVINKYLNEIEDNTIKPKHLYMKKKQA